jgi:hypothetical protein
VERTEYRKGGEGWIHCSYVGNRDKCELSADYSYYARANSTWGMMNSAQASGRGGRGREGLDAVVPNSAWGDEKDGVAAEHIICMYDNYNSKSRRKSKTRNGSKSRKRAKEICYIQHIGLH